ncbi:c-type cytochrome biogenesis protein CcmI [Limnohabitans sp. Jir72]|uniref:c-type cytochrome biogenesis protein CcmI n=1 Tax=Limnohabitans sp. Jir72 TaxID=1977909 RepID=UPI000D36A7AA|nr:c-type cytochrome biogenesis protein CcmI [Limnohabitans sp. Jir72]PUE33924.1 c-type cytochrome biogenesis protein CcmI [Limnohabitans sp. Jir72]
MSFLPPWVGLLLALLLFGALAAWVLRRGLARQAANLAQVVTGEDVQAQAHRRIQQQHLADLDRALTEGRLNANQHAAARDELMRQVLLDQAQAGTALQRGGDGVTGPVRWGWIVLLLGALSGLSYLQLGAQQTWWPVPLSQRVQISATSPEQLAEQTRVWQQATQNRPDDAEAWLTLARLQAAQNAHAQAEQALARVLALSPEPDLWIERAQMKALSAGGVYTGEPWQWIENVLREQPRHLNALVLAGSAAWSEKRHAAAQSYWQRALGLVPADSEAAQGLQQALAQAQAASPAAELAQGVAAPPSAAAPGTALAGDARPVIQGEVRLSPELQKHIVTGATLFVYALAEEGSRRPVAIWRSTPTSWPVRFALSDSMGMGAPPVLSSLAQVRLVARISQTGSAQKQAGDLQVELPGVKTGVQGVVLDITGR